MARTRNLVTMERVAEILGEDVEWLIDIAIELEPEDGCLTVFGPGEQWFYALSEDGVENLKELIQIHRTGR
ncbi:hypothetical protein ABAZ39_18900 (plasmid) [Azospirillum argentinense]|uniref:Uncharacterized protein n=1 Tax=Azospirillum argentinense TaxID=2970906 RepID=A0A060DSS9_9PROT|nr:hypothetical protein [Azospirillum argentinense]AIB12749.1 hypothetical protein ABAZ39_12265 [Azospirillum argentinense]AIB13999.1 hypothetical protein ABAZ39_18900 [Azospirillum argentinense]EZQ05738.1 hypothetical protein ABAZ39_19200 [Azospirillum argentinense]EZQ09522.1 hypothetical protein ABAZ39_13690 [Azospirillum argentinense]PNQ95035.1 hypothetical protein C1S70_30990 [Azospirillum argentinense]